MLALLALQLMVVDARSKATHQPCHCLSIALRQSRSLAQRPTSTDPARIGFVPNMLTLAMQSARLVALPDLLKTLNAGFLIRSAAEDGNERHTHHPCSEERTVFEHVF